MYRGGGANDSEGNKQYIESTSNGGGRKGEGGAVNYKFEIKVLLEASKCIAGH